MLAKRLVASVPVDERPSASESWRADPNDASRTPAYARSADEILFVAAPGIGHPVVLQRLRELAGLVFVPVTVLLPTTTREQLDELVQAGADRVYLWAAHAAAIVPSAVSRWGSQCVGVCLALEPQPGSSEWRLAGTDESGAPALEPDKLAALAAAGAGEVLVLVKQADLGDCVGALRAFSDRLDVPVIVGGTARTTEGLRRVLIEGGVAGLVFEPACIEEFEDVAQIKTYLAAAGIVVRGA